jgi:hypothetical protein
MGVDLIGKTLALALISITLGSAHAADNTPVLAPENSPEAAKNLPPEKQDKLRARWEKFQNLPPHKKQAVRHNYRKFSELPPERQQRVRERFEKLQKMPPEKRREKLLRVQERHTQQTETKQ